MVWVASPMVFIGIPSVMAKMDSESVSVPRKDLESGFGSGRPSSSWRQPQKKGDERVTSSDAKISFHSPWRRPVSRAGACVGFRASMAWTSCSASRFAASLPHWPLQVEATATSSWVRISRRAAVVPAASADAGTADVSPWRALAIAPPRAAWRATRRLRPPSPLGAATNVHGPHAGRTARSTKAKTARGSLLAEAIAWGRSELRRS
mmetsp:Transcript_10346/g.30733  ORF Transcript_10346/g.30733 Transcript_10346/m.30733 type:complete len:207 (+) Transcript_10346:434-1054(+)